MPGSLSAAEATKASFPFTMHGDLIWVDVDVAGRGEPLHFVFDTGAETTILDLTTARQLGVDLGRREPVQGVHGTTNAYKVRNLGASVASLELPPSPLALDLSPVSRSVNRKIDGLLGADFFRSAVVRIDYGTCRISIDASRGVRTPSGEELPLRRRNGILCARATIDGIDSQWMRIDTGCSEPLHWALGDGERTLAARRKSVAVASGRVVFTHTTVLLGSRTLDGVRTGLHRNRLFRDEDGLLGNGLLSKFRAVTLDTREGKLYLE